jgi:Uncharacterized protein conserved in bacteria (DUF2188)
MATRRYVRQNAKGGWDVVKEGHQRATAHAETQAKAVARARDLARREGGGDVRVLSRAGKVVEANTVPPSRAAKRTNGKVTSSGR